MAQQNITCAYMVIDMQRAYTQPDSPLCVAGAAATVPAICRTLAQARAKGMPVIWVRREYRPNGSDIDLSRYLTWRQMGSPVVEGSEESGWAQGLEPLPQDYVITKRRWSAFFGTELDLLLRRLGIRTLVIVGTALPNCVRATCYDATSLDYNVVLLRECCSAQTEEVAAYNLADLERMGVSLLHEADFPAFSALSDPLHQIRPQL